ncbi:MAG: hypothetical protein WCA08_03300, partial [Desulfoferrobacter sp.]
TTESSSDPAQKGGDVGHAVSIVASHVAAFLRTSALVEVSLILGADGLKLSFKGLDFRGFCP